MKKIMVSLAHAFGTKDENGNIIPLPGIDEKLMVEAIDWDGTETGDEALLRQMVPVVDWVHPIPIDVLRDLLIWNHTGGTDTVLLFGPTGAGKSRSFLQWHARLGKPLVRYTMHRDTELFELFGSRGLRSGETVFEYGPLVVAAKHGIPICLDEFSRAKSEVNVGLNGVFDVCLGAVSSFALPGSDEMVTPKNGFTILATDNTNLCGDESGLYNTALIQDVSLNERFALAIKVDYPPDDNERAILFTELSGVDDDFLGSLFQDENMEVTVNGIKKKGDTITRSDFVEAILDFRKKIRVQSRDGDNQTADALERTMSVRTLQRWAQYIVAFSGANKRGFSALHYSLARVLTNTCTPTTKEAIHKMLTLVFNVDEKRA